MDLRIEADRDLERGDAADAGGELGGVGVAVGAGGIDAADLARRVAAQGDDVADAGVPVVLDHLVDLGARGVDAGQVGGRRKRVSSSMRSTVRWVRSRVEPPAP